MTFSLAVARSFLGPETGPAAGTGQHAGGLNPMAAGGAVEPMAAELALNFRKTLFFLAFRAATVHFAILDVLREKKAALGAFVATPFLYFGAAVRQGANKDGFTAAAPVFPFF
ncbi:MAG: hypothetical protein GX751_01645 [Desulfuromonadaceae bacterium]|nr:hypothetical protein [Desulfuromonadaceae bacterium]